MKNKKRSHVNLTPIEALLLQQVLEDGENDASILAEQVGMSRKLVVELVVNLRRKGLLKIEQVYDELWVKLTTQGKRLIQSLWPESCATRA